MEKGWVNVFTTDQRHLAEIAKELLSENQIESVLVDKKDSVYITIGEIELYVRDTNVMRAKFILEKNSL
jgi:hypothetical protein